MFERTELSVHFVHHGWAEDSGLWKLANIGRRFFIERLGCFKVFLLDSFRFLEKLAFLSHIGIFIVAEVVLMRISSVLSSTVGASFLISSLGLDSCERQVICACYVDQAVTCFVSLRRVVFFIDISFHHELAEEPLICYLLLPALRK